MFVHTSVIVAILSGEADAGHWVELLETSAGRLITSPLVVLEAAMRLSTLFAVDPVAVADSLKDFLREAGIDIVPIDAAQAWLAIEAFERYGKGRGHPARLNLADCFSYASAKGSGVALLYKGEDFARTDLA